MNKVVSKKESALFLKIAEGFWTRVRKGPRKLTAIAAATGIPYNTLQMWGAHRNKQARAIPNIFDLWEIAQAQGVSPAWLAWDLGPQDPTAAHAANDLGWLIEKTPGLDDVLEAYSDGDAEDKQAMRTMGRWISGKKMDQESDVVLAARANPISPDVSRIPRIVAGGTRELHIAHNHDDKITTYAAPAKDTGVSYGKMTPIENRPRPVNRRDEIPTYPMSRKQEVGAHGLTHFTGLAAGFGEDLRRSDDLWYFRELPDWKGIHSAEIISDSMADTLVKRDIVLLRPYGAEGLELAPRGDNPRNSLRRFRAEVPDDSICVISINDGTPTLKRVVYDTSRGEINWRLVITADNPSIFRPIPISRDDKIHFFARVIGRGEAAQELMKPRE